MAAIDRKTANGSKSARNRKYSGATVAPLATIAMLEAADGVVRVKGLTTAFEGGATRSTQGARFDLIPPAAVRALARRLTLGAARHGERNWESGGEAFRQATVSHLMAHLLAYMDKPNQEDADALICNSAFLCHFEAKRVAKV